MERADAFMKKVSGKDVIEDDLAAFLELAGFVSSKQEARSHPNWDRWASHRMALSWHTEDVERSGRSVLSSLTRRLTVNRPGFGGGS